MFGITLQFSILALMYLIVGHTMLNGCKSVSITDQQRHDAGQAFANVQLSGML